MDVPHLGVGPDQWERYGVCNKPWQAFGQGGVMGLNAVWRDTLAALSHPAAGRVEVYDTSRRRSV